MNLNFMRGLLSVLMIGTIFSGTHTAEAAPPSKGPEYTVMEYGDGTGIITAYGGSGGTVVIPSDVNGVKIVAIGGSAFANKRINLVTIPDTVTSAGDGAFANNAISTISILNSKMTIGANFLGGNSSIPTIRGYNFSTAEMYALQNGYPFNSMGMAPTTPTPPPTEPEPEPEPEPPQEPDPPVEPEEPQLPTNRNASIQASIEVIPGELEFTNIRQGSDFFVHHLNGKGQSLNAVFKNAMDVVDARGVYPGYTIEVQMTDLVSETGIIPKSEISFENLQTINIDGVSGPPHSISAFSAFSLVSLGQGKGIGIHTIDLSEVVMNIYLSETTRAGNYLGTMTFTLVSSP